MSLHEDWFSEYSKDTRERLRGRFTQPVLRGIREEVIQSGVSRAGEMARDLSLFEDYFAKKLQFRKWLITISYRESLRVLPTFEPIENALDRLPSDQRRILLWCYVEQLTEDDVARVLSLESESQAFFCQGKARQTTINAYKALCQIVLSDFGSAETDRGRFAGCSWILPSPPNLHGNVGLEIERGPQT